MENFEKLIEKYKRDMISLSKRSSVVPEEEPTEKTEAPYVAEPQKETEAADEIPKNEEIADENPSMHFGALKVIVFAGNEAFPVEAARVEVYDKSGTLLYSLLTNSGGIAEGMILPAPNKKENDAPGGKDGFTDYVVRVSHPDYESVEFDDVQVFEGIESIQQVFFQVMEYPMISEEDSDG